MSRLPPDQNQRERALDTTISCCVQAPAGSGKTELLTQRILKLLAISDRPEEVLAITFTRKAAAEMRNRLLDYLEEASHVDSDTITDLAPHKQHTFRLASEVIKRDRELGWSLLSNTSRLRINTIDSFNQYLVNQLPVTSALGMLPEITEKPALVFRDAIRDTLEALDDDSVLARELAVLLAHLNNDWAALESLFTRLLYKRDQWLSYILFIKQDARRTRELMEATLADIVESNLAALETALAPYLSRLLPLLQFAVANMNAPGFPVGPEDLEDSLPDCMAAALPHWQALLPLILKKDNTPRQKLASAQGFPAQSIPGSKVEKARRKQCKADMEALLAEMAGDTVLLERFNEISFVPDPHFNADQWQVLESLTVILPALVSRLNLAFARHGKTDYPHVSAAALEALGEEEQPTDLALRLDYQLKHILVDEFQDTSSMQISLLKKLTHGWQPGDGRTLFIVGDGMQSCYGFRNARVGLFLAARDHGIGSVRFEDLRLSCNFRSEDTVVEWVNRIFREAFPRVDDISRGGVSFNHADAIKPGSPIGGVKVGLIKADKELENSLPIQRHQEALYVAQAIESIRSSNPKDSIAVLVRGKSHLRELIPVLREKGLEWNASEIDPLLSYPVIRDLLVLTRALLNVGDKTAWLALLRSPIAGLKLADIHALAMQANEIKSTLSDVINGFAAIKALSPEAVTILERLQPILAQARAQRQRLPLRDWVENTWVLLGGPLSLETTALADITGQYFNHLEEHDSGGDIADIHRFEEELNALFGSGQHPESRLQIMTIHKAKGLEFDHVIIPALDRRPRSNDNPLLLWKEHISHEGFNSLVLSLPARKGQERDKDPVYRYLKVELELERQLETTRLMYIAVTRAIRQAILVACVVAENDEIKAPVKTSLLARLWPQVANSLEEDFVTFVHVDEHSPMPVSADTNSRDKPILSRRLVPAWRNKVITAVSPEPVDTLVPDSDDMAHHNMLEKTKGNIIHHCLMRMSQGQFDPQSASQLAAIEPAWHRQLAPLTDNPHEVIAGIREQLDICQQHEKFNWVVTLAHQDQACELAISDYSRGQRQEFVIDRTFLDKDGVRWIIDYKTATPRQDESLGMFVSRQTDKYQRQLAVYARLFSTMESAPVKTALFFPGVPCFHEVDHIAPLPDSQPAGI